MKKTNLILCCFVALIAFSCQKDESSFQFIDATIEPYHSNAKVHLEGNIAHWDDKDAVSINGLTDTLKVSNDRSQIVLTHGVSDNYYALFPAEAAQSFSNNQYTIQLPSIQELRVDNSGRQIISGLMAACGSSTLAFHNLTSLLAIQLPTEISVTCITVKAINANSELIPLCGDATVSFANGTPTMSNLINGDSVTLVCPPQYRANRSRFYVVIPPVQDAKFIIRITFLRDGKVCTKTVSQTSASNTLTASCIAGLSKGLNDLGNTPAGLFSISSSQKVCISQGNLQYIGSATDPYWKFADNQYDIIGETQNTGSTTLDRDLFGWGTSGDTVDEKNLYPYLITISINDYYTSSNLTSETDWGQYNTISNGGTGWYTLSHSEWNYLINTRTSSYAKAIVNGVKGIILLPDNFSSPSNISITLGEKYTSNELTLLEWIVVESKGAIFLPAAGYRQANSLSEINTTGRYWASDYNGNASSVYFFQFTSSGKDIKTKENYYGHSVRLVQNYTEN